MEFDHLLLSGHAVQRMYDRAIGVADVETALREGKVIAVYPDDRPFTSCLVLAFVAGDPIHVVAALDAETRTCHVVTVYRPSPDLWDAAFRRRKTK